MAPPADLTARNDDAHINFTANNPLQDKSFINIVIGLGIGAFVFLIIIGLILFLYRERSPLTRRLQRKKEEQLAKETSSLESSDTNDSTQRLVEKKSSWVDRLKFRSSSS